MSTQVAAGQTITIEARCPMCDTPGAITVNLDAWADWRNGVLIQVAFPDLDDGERELLMTGLCGPCFDVACTPLDN